MPLSSASRGAEVAPTRLCALFLLASWLLAPGGLCAADAPLPPGALDELAPPPPLVLSRPRVGLERRLLAGLDRVAPPIPMEEWAPGLTIAEQAGRTVAALQDPVDITGQYRVPIDLCPNYWPEHEPEKNTAQLCGAQLMDNWQLEQVLRHNPLRIASDQLELINRDPEARDSKLAWLGAYLWVHRREEDALSGAADLLLSRERYGRNDVLWNVLGPKVIRKVPGALTQVVAAPGEVAIDLRVTDEFSFDSVATSEQVLLTAAERGIGAVVIAGRTQLGDGQAAERLAERLKRQGRLPEGFRVVVGQYVVSRTGSVVGLFLKDRLLEGQTMAETVAAIHRQGGLAYLARPGDIGATPSLIRLHFDGFLIQSGNFELFRTLLLLDLPELRDKPALYASNSSVSFGVGLPYSSVLLDPNASDPLKAGLERRQGYAAGTLYLPWMMALLIKPVAIYQKTLNRYFQVNDELVLRAGRLLGADNVLLRTSWDDGMRDLISLSHSYRALHRIQAGGSELTRLPRLTYIEAEYGWFSVGYDRMLREVVLTSRWRW